MADEARGPESTIDSVQELRIERHHLFCTALPFPRLDWSATDATRKSLDELHDYALQMGNSALDWYLRKKNGKKRIARTLHWGTYIAGAVAAAIPLLKLSNVVNISFIKQCCGANTDFNSLAAEMSLALIGVAAGLALIDKSAGFSDDWMRYITTAADINRALIEFNFDWDKLDQTRPYPPQPSAQPVEPPPIGPIGVAGPPTAAANTEPNPVAARIELVKTVCLKIVDLTNAETQTWATGLKERLSQKDRQLARPQ